MKPWPAGGVALLDAEDAAELLGISMSQFRHLEEIHVIQPMTTPVSHGYREDEMLELAEVIAPAVAKQNRIRPRDAARILGVTTRTLIKQVALGRLHRDPQGFYDAAEVRGLAGRKGT
jgi:hypothetical protein